LSHHSLLYTAPAALIATKSTATLFKNIVGELVLPGLDVVTPNFANNSAVVRESGRGGRRRAGGHGEKIVDALEAAGVEFTNGKQPPLPTLCGSSIVLI
jgi:hypothetical protein